MAHLDRDRHRIPSLNKSVSFRVFAVRTELSITTLRPKSHLTVLQRPVLALSIGNGEASKALSNPPQPPKEAQMSCTWRPRSRELKWRAVAKRCNPYAAPLA